MTSSMSHLPQGAKKLGFGKALGSKVNRRLFQGLNELWRIILTQVGDLGEAMGNKVAWRYSLWCKEARDLPLIQDLDF